MYVGLLNDEIVNLQRPAFSEIEPEVCGHIYILDVTSLSHIGGNPYITQVWTPRSAMTFNMAAEPGSVDSCTLNSKTYPYHPGYFDF